MKRNNGGNLKESIKKIADFYPQVLNITKKKAKAFIYFQIKKCGKIYLPLPVRYTIISKPVRDNIRVLYDPRKDEIILFYENTLFTKYAWEDRRELYTELEPEII